MQYTIRAAVAILSLLLAGCNREAAGEEDDRSDVFPSAAPHCAPRNAPEGEVAQPPAMPSTPQKPMSSRDEDASLSTAARLKAIAAAHQAAIERADTPGQWGGELELTLMAKLFNVNIHVFNRSSGSAAHFLEEVDLTECYLLDAGRDREVVYLAYTGNHYDALMEKPVPIGDTGHFYAPLHTVPGDGNCLYHAFAVGARWPFAWEVSDLYQSGRLDLLRQRSPEFRAKFDQIDGMTDEQVYEEFQQTTMVEIRSTVSHELRKPEYAELAYWASLSN